MATASASLTEVARLNWGCGQHPADGWTNSDLHPYPGVALPADLRAGLPVATGTFDYVVSIHALQDLPYLDVVPGLEELRRVLKPGGWLRLGLPDLDRAIAAYNRGDYDYFYVPDAESRTLGGKLSIQMTWYGWSRILFTEPFTVELLGKAGFSSILPACYRMTHSPHPEILDLDNRERETFFIEAVK